MSLCLQLGRFSLSIFSFSERIFNWHKRFFKFGSIPALPKLIIFGFIFFLQKDMFMKHWLIFEKILQNWLMLIFYHFWNFCIKLCVCFVFSVKLNDKFIMQWKKEFNSIKKDKILMEEPRKWQDKKFTLPFISRRIKDIITWLLWNVMV